MPFALVGIGLILIVTGIRDTYRQLGEQITRDFTGQQNFTVWVLAIGSVGALGYVREFRTFSRYFLALILIALILSNRGFFQSFMQQFNAGPLAAPSGTSGAQAQPAPAPGTIINGQITPVPPYTIGGGWWNFFTGNWFTKEFWLGKGTNP